MATSKMWFGRIRLPFFQIFLTDLFEGGEVLGVPLLNKRYEIAEL
jgi:hypothetical protein